MSLGGSLAFAICLLAFSLEFTFLPFLKGGIGGTMLGALARIQVRVREGEVGETLSVPTLHFCPRCLLLGWIPSDGKKGAVLGLWFLNMKHMHAGRGHHLCPCPVAVSPLPHPPTIMQIWSRDLQIRGCYSPSHTTSLLGASPWTPGPVDTPHLSHGPILCLYL